MASKLATRRFIDLLLSDYGHFKRKTVVEYFGVGYRCVTTDVQLYLSLSPGSVSYNITTKRFERSEGFSRYFADEA